MKSILLTLTIFSISTLASIAQNKTDASLFMRSDSVYTCEIQEASGDLYRTIGHHGPAIENEWMALRLYFNNKAAAIDVYNKQKPGLELKSAKWYPTPEEQKNGLGADYYKAGSTLGLGGVRLWDGEKSSDACSCFEQNSSCKKGRKHFSNGNVIRRCSLQGKKS